MLNGGTFSQSVSLLDVDDGSIRVAAGGRFSSSFLDFRQDGRIFVDGGDVSVGEVRQQGNSRIEVGDGGTATFGTMRVSAPSIVQIAGGTLDFNEYVAFLGGPNPGALRFDSGTLRVRSSSGLNTASTFLGGGINLSNDKTLRVDQRLRVGNNSFLSLNGGTLHVGQIEVAGGTIFGNSDLNLHLSTVNNTLRARGTVGVRVGGTSDSQINASGPLTIGNVERLDGFSFPGTLNVDNHQVIVLDADRADLGRNTILAQGGRLSAPNGFNLGSNRSLTATGDALIDGDFTNNGSVDGPTSGDLSFNDNVNGAGSYTGNIRFLQGFSPGNSPGLITFDDVTFGNTSNLDIELGGLLAGTEFDQLRILGDAHLGGELTVSLIDDFPLDYGQSFEILEIAGSRFGQFAGLGEGDLVGTFGGHDLFISYSAGSGNSVSLFTAVPEPATALLMLAAVVPLTLRSKRP